MADFTTEQPACNEVWEQFALLSNRSFQQQKTSGNRDIWYDIWWILPNIYSKYKQIPQFLDLSPHFPLKWLFGWYTPHFQTDPDIIWLVVWNVFYFSHHIENVIIPTDFHILFRGVGMPPTRSLLYLYHIKSHWTIMFLGEITPFSGRPRHHMMKSHELNHH